MRDRKSTYRWVKWLVVSVIVLTIAGMVYREYQISQVVNSEYRFNLVLASKDGGVTFVSFDPEEKQVFAIPFPKNLEIKSRSVGTYRIDRLYLLGGYEDNVGVFVKRKVQGFMRVPIAGFLLSESSEGDLQQQLKRNIARSIGNARNASFSKIDALSLIKKINTYEMRIATEEELVRAGVIVKKEDIWEYNHERLKQYLGSRVFDWSIGATDVSVAVVNASGKDGLATDTAEFLTTLGFDVVTVKAVSGEPAEKTIVKYKELDESRANTLKLFDDIFGWDKSESGGTEEYRADIVVILGKEAGDLF